MVMVGGIIGISFLKISLNGMTQIRMDMEIIPIYSRRTPVNGTIQIKMESVVLVFKNLQGINENR